MVHRTLDYNFQSVDWLKKRCLVNLFVSFFSTFFCIYKFKYFYLGDFVGISGINLPVQKILYVTYINSKCQKERYDTQNKLLRTYATNTYRIGLILRIYRLNFLNLCQRKHLYQ